MSPPIGGTLWRQLADEEGDKPLVVDGHLIPPGTHVGVNVYAIHHNEEYFPEPFTFKPERWIAGDIVASAGDFNEDNLPSLANNRAFTPFSLGDRSCAGKAMAYLEVSLAMAKTLWYFDFKKSPGTLGDVGCRKRGGKDGWDSIGEFELHDMLTSRHDGPNLIFKPRGAFCEDLL